MEHNHLLIMYRLHDDYMGHLALIFVQEVKNIIVLFHWKTYELSMIRIQNYEN